MNISYSPSEDRFNINSSGITIKKYPSDVVSYLFENNLNLLVGNGLRSPFKKENVIVTDETSFPYIRVNGILEYHKNNFRNFQKGTIRFSVKKVDCKNDYAYFSATDFIGIGEGTYSFSFLNPTNGNQNSTDTIIIHIPETTDNINKVVGYIQEAIENKYTSLKPIRCEQINNGVIIRTRFDIGTATTGRIKLTNDNFFHNCFRTIENDKIFSTPDNDTIILGFKEDETKKNQILFVHKTDGNLYLIMSDEDGKFTLEKKLCSWDWTNEEFAEFELNFDENHFIFIVNGKAVLFGDTVGFENSTSVDNIVRSSILNTNLVLVGEYNGKQGDAYDYNKITVFNTKQHCSDYETSHNDFEYNGDGSILYNYGQLKAYDDKDLKINADGPFKFEMLDGTETMVESNSIADFIEKVKKLDYDPSSTLSFETVSDLIFKVTPLSESSTITGFEFTSGTPVYDDDDPYNFEDIYDWVRRECGAPQIKCELTDEQIYDALTEAVAEYNKWRNYDRNLQIESLNSTSETDLRRCHSEKEGTYFVLPANISEKDVIDIYFHPRYSCAWFGAGNDFINNVMAQTFFSRASEMSTTAADYYIYRGSLNDIGNILGTHISWRFYNNHLYITPNNMEWLDQVSIGIVYRQPLTVEEIRNSWQIKRYCLGRSMMILGLIRGTFSNGIPAGDITITLNSETLIATGKEMMNEALNGMKKQQYPLFMIWD